MNAPGISIVAMSRISMASMLHESISASKATIGARASSFVVCGRCLHPSAHPQTLLLDYSDVGVGSSIISFVAALLFGGSTDISVSSPIFSLSSSSSSPVLS